MFCLFTSFLLTVAGRMRRGGVIINGHTLTRSQTRLQLDTLGRCFEFIGLEDLPRRMLGRGRRPFCLLTFDDGKLSNYKEIAPELESRRVPAIFYLPTGPLSTGMPLWFDCRNQLVDRLGHCPAGLELPALKKLSYSLLMERLAHACTHFGFQPQITSDDCRPMSWDQARDLANRGFTIGAHGVSHTILTNETRERAFAEIEESLSQVSSNLGVSCTTFAFPNGNYTPELVQQAWRSGATTVMTTEPIWVDRQSSLGSLPRIQLFGEFTRARTELKIALAALRGVLTNPDGSGRAYRLRQRSKDRDAYGPAWENGGKTVSGLTE